MTPKYCIAKARRKDFIAPGIINGAQPSNRAVLSVMPNIKDSHDMPSEYIINVAILNFIMLSREAFYCLINLLLLNNKSLLGSRIDIQL